MFSFIVLICALSLFCASFHLLNILTTIKSLLEISRNAIGVISDKDLDDATKEKTTQQLALKMLRQTLSLFLKIIFTFSLTLLPFALADIAGMVKVEQSIQFALRLDVLFISTAFIFAIIYIKKIKH